MDSLERDLYKNGFEKIVGIDEAGRGPLAGPVICAAVIFPKSIKPFISKDSKKLSEKERLYYYEMILDFALDVGIGAATPQEIDRLNILQATKLAAERALKSLNTEFDFIITDYLDLGKKNQIHIKKADEVVHTVAAASIVAKVERDRIMKEYKDIYQNFSFDIHKGYPTKLHYMEIKLYGITPIHRKSFNLYRYEADND